jgi:hypothetical protein
VAPAGYRCATTRLVAELRSHERQAAEELEQEDGRRGAQALRRIPAAITLALLLTDQELDSLEKRAGDGEIAGRGRPRGSNVASPQPAARHGEPAQVFPANAAVPERRPRMDGVTCGSRFHRLRAGLDLILDLRVADMVDLPGGASGMLVRGYKGKKADRLVTRIDPGVVSVVAELRGHERQAAEDWPVEDPRGGASGDRPRAGRNRIDAVSAKLGAGPIRRSSPAEF